MNKTKLSWTVNNIARMYEQQHTLSFEHPIQRKSEKWNNEQKSLLLHSMLANFPIPNIYVLREDSEQVDSKGKPVFSHFVMDGKQRLTSVLSYIAGEYPLEDNIANISIDDVEYEIAGKYFTDLDEPVRFEILRFKFEIVCFEDATDREVEEIFYRLNNSTPLSKSDVAKAKMGCDIAEFTNEMLNSRFFTTSCNFTKGQIKASDNQRVLIQAMMLLDTNNIAGFELNDFSENSILAYSERIRDTYTDKQKNILQSAIQYLGDSFPEKNRELRKISIPMLIYLADVAEDAEIRTRLFRDWWNYFTEEDELMDVYKTFCSSGSTKLEKIKGRLAVMTKSFCSYHEIDIPEELKDMVAEVEEKLAAKEENGEAVPDGEMESPSEESDHESQTEDMTNVEPSTEEDTESHAEDGNLEMEEESFIQDAV